VERPARNGSLVRGHDPCAVGPTLEPSQKEVVSVFRQPGWTDEVLAWSLVAIGEAST
jgi:hypothetical protein